MRGKPGDGRAPIHSSPPPLPNRKLLIIIFSKSRRKWIWVLSSYSQSALRIERIILVVVSRLEKTSRKLIFGANLKVRVGPCREGGWETWQPFLSRTELISGNDSDFPFKNHIPNVKWIWEESAGIEAEWKNLPGNRARCGDGEDGGREQGSPFPQLKINPSHIPEIPIMPKTKEPRAPLPSSQDSFYNSYNFE